MFRKVLERLSITSKKPTANEAIEDALKSIFEGEKKESSGARELREQLEFVEELNSKAKEGLKLDQGKLAYTLLPFKAITEVVKVLEFGKQKYAKDNWQKVANGKERYLDAALRHLISYVEGEVSDHESKLPHLAHATCCLLFILWFDLTNKSEEL